jgi:alpha-beta hydrolase superfamily lysophospholipase
MENVKTKNKFRQFGKLVLWVLLVQFILINISASIYGYKLTHFYNSNRLKKSVSPKNIFTKTWKLFTGPRYIKSAISEIPQFAFETVMLNTRDHIPIEAWYSRVDSAKGTIILFHGISTNKSYMLPEAYDFRWLGYNVMLVDLRAHGNSGGNYTTAGFKESEEVKLAYDYACQQGNKNIFLFGVSMGAVIVMKAISDYNIQPAGIILEMPFASLHDHLKARARTLGFPEEPFGFLVTFWAGLERGFNGFKHNTCLYAEKVNCPVLMQWGALDNYVLRGEIERVYQHIPSQKKKLVVYDHASHESLLNNEPIKWRKEVSDFLKE